LTGAQHFYRKLGYKDCGGFVVDAPGYETTYGVVPGKSNLSGRKGRQPK